MGIFGSLRDTFTRTMAPRPATATSPPDLQVWAARFDAETTERGFVDTDALLDQAETAGAAFAHDIDLLAAEEAANNLAFLGYEPTAIATALQNRIAEGAITRADYADARDELNVDDVDDYESQFADPVVDAVQDEREARWEQQQAEAAERWSPSETDLDLEIFYAAQHDTRSSTDTDGL